MSTVFVNAGGRDPIVARDSRPFGAGQGNRMRSLDWVTPSVVSGAVRTAIGRTAGRNFDAGDLPDLLSTEIAGFFPSENGDLYLPAPADCVARASDDLLRARPLESSELSTDLPAYLSPVGLTQQDATQDFKPVGVPAWWPSARYAKWLAGDPIHFDRTFLVSPKHELRTHIEFDPELGAARDQRLFTSAAIPIERLCRFGTTESTEVSLSVRLRPDGWCAAASAQLKGFHTLGGERRLLYWSQAATTGSQWTCPASIRSKLKTEKRVRMVLGTPAIFDHGWRPAWLGNHLKGCPPGSNVELELVGVCIHRWQPISGWSLVEKGPKAIRRAVRAGGVYFFNSTGPAVALADRWLESVSDNRQDRKDGFGLATWGVW